MKKYAAITVLFLIITASATGCGNKPKNLAGDGDTPEAAFGTSDTSTTSIAESLESASSESVSLASEAYESETPSSETISISKTDEIIGGNVRSISNDSFVISRTLIDEDGYVTLPPEKGSPDEVLVTIRCTDSTVFEHWTIQGGGARIDKRNAAFSEIKEDGGLEAEGYFDGDAFVAKKVIIETYQ